MAVTAAPGPSVMMTTASAPPVVVTAPAAAHVSVAMPVAALDLDQGAVHRRRGRYAQPGGSGYGHGQRSKQRSSNQNETSHLASLPSRNRDQAQVPDERVCSRGPKLNPQCDIRASGATYSRQCAAAAEFYVVRDATTKKCTVVDTKPTTTTTTIVDNGTFKTKTKAESA
jgi:hypothetical protein